MPQNELDNIEYLVGVGRNIKLPKSVSYGIEKELSELTSSSEEYSYNIVFDKLIKLVAENSLRIIQLDD